MWRPGTEAPGGVGGEVQQCPLRSSWSTMLDKSGVWQYSVPGGKQGGAAQVQKPVQKPQDLRQMIKSSATALHSVAAHAQVQAGHPNRKPKPKPEPEPKAPPEPKPEPKRKAPTPTPKPSLHLAHHRRERGGGGSGSVHSV